MENQAKRKDEISVYIENQEYMANTYVMKYFYCRYKIDAWRVYSVCFNLGSSLAYYKENINVK